jgi:magnesium-transporting ATPase (P-type)
MKNPVYGSAPSRQQNALVDPGNGVPPDAKKNGWHVVDVDSAMETLHTSMGGLSSSQAAELLKLHGFNELTERKKKTMLERIWNQINNMLVGILSVVAVVSAAKAIASTNPEEAVTDWIEVGLIVFVICLNTWIGLMQEGSAEKAAEALRSMLPSNAEVIRDSTNKEVPARELVPGDIVILKTGDKVPADVRLFAVSNLACTEAALTGESLPVDKMTLPMTSPEDIPLGDRKNMCFSATLVAHGRGMGVVVATGDNTQIGTINALVNNVEEKKSAVLEQIDNVSMIIVASVITVGLMTFTVSFFYAELTVLDSVEIALVCAISMIPEGLASIVCLTYAHAVSNMAKLNAIVRMLPAVETLGSV